MNRGKEVTGVILAGGRGARMGELTQEKQKCMLPVDGQPILQHILDNIQNEFGSANIIIATGHRGDLVRQYFGSKYANIDIEYVHNPQPIETKKRLLLAAESIKGPFLFTAGDIISHPAQLGKVVASFDKERGSGLMSVISGAMDHIPALSHALITTDDHRAVEMIFPPTPTWNPQQLREMHIAYYDKSFLYRVRNTPEEQIYLSTIIADALRYGEDFAVDKYFDRWYHFVKPEDLQTKIEFNNRVDGAMP